MLPAQSRGVHSQSERELLFLISVLFSVLEQAPHIAFVHIVRVREVACVRKLLAVYALVTVSEHHFQILLQIAVALAPHKMAVGVPVHKMGVDDILGAEHIEPLLNALAGHRHGREALKRG